MSWHCFGDTRPKARKEHRCDLCGLDISTGTTYVARRGLADQGPITMHLHTACEALTHDWDEGDWESGWDEMEFRKSLPRVDGSVEVELRKDAKPGDTWGVYELHPDGWWRFKTEKKMSENQALRVAILQLPPGEHRTAIIIGLDSAQFEIETL